MTLTDMEMERQRRMEENKRRMEQLGLQKMADEMTNQAAADAPPKRERKRRAEAALAAEPTRRSSRNEGRERPNYCLIEERTGGGASRGPRDGPLVPEGDKPEEYGVEHVRALGSYQQEWELFRDGYTEQGERIYDNVNGASCHQCRQKTVGLRTSCSRCKSGRGKLCGDCLFVRYGENVEEAAANPDWVCPCCRDFCNCSNHRQKRGWAKTGQLGYLCRARGFLSVAHYLVLTKATGLEAKRAALASGFCPPDLEEQLEHEIEGLEKEAALAPPPPPAPEPAAEDAPAEQQQQEKKKRQRKPAASKAKTTEQQAGERAAESAADAVVAQGEGKEKKTAAGRRKPAAAAAEEVPAGGGKAKKGSGGKKAAAASTSDGPVGDAAKQDDGAARGRSSSKGRQRKRKSGSPAAAAGVLETSGGGASGAVAACTSPSAEVSAPAAAEQGQEAAPKQPVVVYKKAPFALGARRRAAGPALPGSGAALMEAAAAALAQL